MKKIIALALIGLAITAHNAFGQAMINVKEYSRFFLNGNGDIARRYYREATDADYNWIATLGGDQNSLDTPLEITLLSMCTGVIDIRPAEADAILPKNNPKLADQKLGAAVFQEIQVLRFLGDTAAVSRHEAVLKWITDRKNATRQEIEAFYRDNVRALIAAVVDEEFNKISFLLRINSSTSYNCVLTRNTNDQYLLSYESYFGTDTKSTKTLTITSLEALQSALQNSGHFSADAINTVKAQAALIPVAALSDAALNEIKTILTNFYITPNATTYDAVKDVYILFDNIAIRDGGQPVFVAVSASYVETLRILNDAVAGKVVVDRRAQTVARNLSRDQQQRLGELRK